MIYFQSHWLNSKDYFVYFFKNICVNSKSLRAARKERQMDIHR